MSQEIRLAFAHPLERSQASAEQAQPLDRISLRDHIVTVEIGAFQAERGVTQRIAFNIVVEVRHAGDDLGDDVDRILSYDRVTEAIDIELAAERLNLLETLAERVADRILLEPQAERVFVRIEKLDRGGGALGVEIVRAASHASIAARDEDIAPHPRVVFLSNQAVASSRIGDWLTQLAADPAPVILCVGPGAAPRPTAQHAAAQRRIDLLAIEQNAWVLADRDPRCVVVETRTELDWAMKNGQISLWAPSKLVLDAVDGPENAVTDAGRLCLWLAEQLEAAEVVSIGEKLPTSTGLQYRFHAVDTDRL